RAVHPFPTRRASDLDDHWREYKIQELKEIILACAGLYLEASADTPSTSPESRVAIAIEAVNRSSRPIELRQVEILGTGAKVVPKDRKSTRLNSSHVK